MQISFPNVATRVCNGCGVNKPFTQEFFSKAKHLQVDWLRAAEHGLRSEPRHLLDHAVVQGWDGPTRAAALRQPYAKGPPNDMGQGDE